MSKRRIDLRRSILIVTAAAEGLLLILLPKVIIVNGSIGRAENSSYAAVVDLRSAFAYTAGMLIIAALCYKVFTPYSETKPAFRADLDKTTEALAKLRLEVEAITENLTAPSEVRPATTELEGRSHEAG